METKGKIIFLDWGMFLFKSIYAWRRNKEMHPEYVCMNMILSCLRKVGVEPFDKIIIAVDKGRSWRKEIDTAYKADRKEKREACEDIDWKFMFKRFDDLLAKINAGTDWHIVSAEHCLSGDTRISTPKGNKSISNIEQGNKIYSYNMKNNKIEISEVKNVQKTQSFHRYNIYFEGIDLPLKITKEHPIYTLNGWKKVKDLKIGDIIWHYFDSQLLNRTSCQKELGYFNGYLLGDGYINADKKYVTFSSNDYGSIKYLKKIARKIFNLRPNILSYKKNNPRWNRNYVICLQGTRKIYAIINSQKLKKNKDYKKGFVAGFYDAEGTFNKTRNIIRITNTDKKLIDYVYGILKDLKFKPKKYKFKGKKGYLPIFAIDLNGNNKTVRFFQTFKTVISRKKLKTISNGLKIKKIEYILSNKQYINHNFESYPNNNYFANGLLVHNCEADDWMSAGSRYFKDSEVVLVTFDADMEQLVAYPNVKIFSPMIKMKGKKGGYKVIKNPYLILSKKIQKEMADNLGAVGTTEEDYEKRKMIVSLLELPNYIENQCITKFDNLEEKTDYNLEVIPFPTIKTKIAGIYNDKKALITYEDCVKYNLRKKKRKAKHAKRKVRAKN